MSDWISLIPIADFPVGSSRCFVVRDRRIAVFRTEDGWHGFDDTCPHAQAPLSDGWLEDGCVICPWHGAQFDLQTGEPVTPPAVTGVQIYQLRVENDTLQLSWPEN